MKRGKPEGFPRGGRACSDRGGAVPRRFGGQQAAKLRLTPASGGLILVLCVAECLYAQARFLAQGFLYSVSNVLLYIETLGHFCG